MEIHLSCVEQSLAEWNHDVEAMVEKGHIGPVQDLPRASYSDCWYGHQWRLYDPKRKKWVQKWMDGRKFVGIVLAIDVDHFVL